MVGAFRCRTKVAVLVGIMVMMPCGCRTIPTRGPDTAARSTRPISRVVALWSEAVLRENNVPVAQGFAGKIYLFGQSKLPVTAPGKFTVYAYDETSATTDAEKATHVKPDFTWEILESDLTDLLKKDAVGWSYSLWLPCATPAPSERRYTILVCFTPENGPRVVGESTLVTLPALINTRNAALAQSRSAKVPANGVTPPIKLANAPIRPNE